MFGFGRKSKPAKPKPGGKPSLRQQRLAICARCPNRTQERRPRCALCGCFLDAKVAIATERCPAGFW